VANTSNGSQQLDKNGLVKPILSHEIVQAYIREEASDFQNQEIAQIKEEHSEYELFFYLLDELKSKITPSEIPENKSQAWLTHSELEAGFYKILTGEIKHEEAQRMISTLHQSETSYRKALTKVGEFMPQMHDVPELSEIAIKSDEEILSEIIGTEPVPHSIAGETGKASWLKHVLTYRITLPSYAYLAPALIILISLISFEIIQDEKAYVYDNKVPVPFSTNVTTFRDISGATQFENFLHQFIAAMRDYERLDYKSALDKLEKIRPQADAILDESEHENAAILVMDYYFYLGVTHFALFRSQKSQSDETKHGNKAVEYLETSREIAETNGLPIEDRNRFFLALAYGFSNEAKAAAELSQIAPESPYFEESRKWLEKWSDYTK